MIFINDLVSISVCCLVLWGRGGLKDLAESSRPGREAPILTAPVIGEEMSPREM